MKSGRLSILGAAVFAMGNAMIALGPTAAADRPAQAVACKTEADGARGGCDRIGYYACVAGGGHSNACADAHGCGREVY
jgi:hypothetical protein